MVSGGFFSYKTEGERTMELDRIGRLKEQMIRHDLEAMIVVGAENMRYVSGFTGPSGYVVVVLGEGGEDRFLITDSRYLEQAKEEASDFNVVQYDKHAEALIADIMSSRRVSRVGFEKDNFTYSEYERFREKFDSLGLGLEPAPDLVGRLRAIKEDREIELIRRAARIADTAFSAILQFIRPGVRERELANELEYILKKLGADEVAFPVIVASGPRTSMPHAGASNRSISYGDLILLDFGATVDGYRSDMTRTVAMGSWSSQWERVYSTVVEAQTRAIQEVAPNRSAKEIDGIARTLIDDYGFDSKFGHGLGHGVGLAVHELPRLSPLSDDILQPGMVFTVEPGIYLPGLGGIRVEDLVLVTDSGHEVLSTTAHEMISV